MAMNLLKSGHQLSYLLLIPSRNNQFRELIRSLTTVTLSKFEKFNNERRRTQLFKPKQMNILMNASINDHVRRFTIETFIDEKAFETIADETLDLLSEKLENIVEQVDPNVSDIVFNNGVITLSLGPKGTFVINKQTPNRQIWLSSPISGPKRYDYINGQWIYKHNGESLEQLLQTELQELFQTNVQF